MDRLFVRFTDNDFCTTVRAFVEAIAPNVLLGGWTDVSKKDIVRLFNEHAFALYALYQCHNVNAAQNLRAYLKIEATDVFFDDEIDTFTNLNGDGCLAVVEHDGIGYYMM